jgi:cobalt transporter subunit CbtA
LDAFRRIVFVAVIAGLVTGVLVTVAHHFGTASIILKAEVYEKAAEQAGKRSAATEPAADAGAMARSMLSMEHNAKTLEWEPADGFERSAYTALADIVTAIAFALLLTSAYALRGGDVDWRKGLFWGLAGFATFTLAPSLGLPPELPGTEAAPLLSRQIWWSATALATGGALALLFLQRRLVWAVAGIVLLILPHLYGAPQPAEYRSAAPGALAYEFLTASIVTSLLFWLALGSLTGHFYKIIEASTKDRAMLGSSGLRV